MISSVTNDRCYEFRGLKEDFERIKNDAAFNAKVGNGSIFLIIDEEIAAWIYDEQNKTWRLFA